ncbi:cytochrome-c oxidase, cbb3-type subunit III [Aquabacterium fontiphilum]|jgi:cytochrome c oxidase cbb3-type subunit 3|uniref:cytochrome-c oxidase, cbb3-type subunit III n=1 Tax=Aquabacterium fontiphilum TaxID=450365 RepID=UPI001376C86A|nr:cytochrome-c oxidase, cbb3-type subunit III [Aquabacterium fontiphilum]NBD19871.1 cytochrome-c oxidase, cbb3-type subunit III [Aquabacterium fontiphilum]
MSDFVSSGWAWYVAALVVAGLLYCAFVLIGAARHKVIYDAQGNVDKTTGHVWDGDLQELNNPLPRWWLMLFIITLVFAVAYFFFYPGLGIYQGSLKWSATGQLQNEIARAKLEQDKIFGQFAGKSHEELASDPAAMAIGQRLFLNNCAACHGSDAKGSKSFPNLTDGDWLHGGSPEKIVETIAQGRQGQMPPLAAAVGSPEEVRQVAHHVLSLSGSGHNPVLAAQGREKFKAVCAACHGADGKGNQAIGAPNLTDKIWLHGWGEEAIVRAINNGIVNVMPAQSPRLSDDQIKVVASYVWGLSNTTKVADAK